MDYYIEYHPKPIKGDWNGSGMHANFSNTTIKRRVVPRETYEADLRSISTRSKRTY